MLNKKEIRSHLIDKRNRLTDLEVVRANSIINQKISSNIDINDKKIAFYCSIENEINLEQSLTQALNSQTRCYLPRISKQKKIITFLEYTDKASLKKSNFNILEPPLSSPEILPTELDIVFVPLIGFDLQGNRLGRGAGHYDKVFHFKTAKPITKPLLIGLAYDFQLLEYIPTENHDVKLDEVITEKNYFNFHSDNS